MGRSELFYFSGDGRCPNSRLPLIVYRGVFAQRAEAMEEGLRQHDWHPTWRSPIGFWPHHHFHTRSHELIVVVRGSAVGCFGGHRGAEVAIARGDAVLIPAGVGHRGLSISQDLFVTGAFPAGSGVLDFRLGYPEEYAEMCLAAESTAVPPLDPFFGATGPLQEHWRQAQARASA